ncbi:MucB/RseB C-terminal domain-containing protein [Psychrosphaera haliotis]|nr:MucB/RseB C-terminal domain-containing protein [Psychrosphaera haliotis]
MRILFLLITCFVYSTSAASTKVVAPESEQLQSKEQQLQSKEQQLQSEAQSQSKAQPQLKEQQLQSEAQPQQATTPNGEKINAAYWLKKLQEALTKSNFEAGIVTLKGEKTESYQWTHGFKVNDDGTEVEIERVSPLIGNGITAIRKNQTLSFFESNKEPYSISGVSIRNFIPAIFYKDFGDLVDSYQFVLVSKSQIAGRSAQLIRVESVTKEAYNFWVWIDVISGLPLRMAYIDEQGEVVEQVLMTHLSYLTEPNEEINKLFEIQLPQVANTAIAMNQQTNNWQLEYTPNGFELLKSDRHHVSINREVADYYLFSDGLVEYSVYVQRPIESFNSPLVLKDGGTSFVMVHADGFDVTVVGMLPTETAFKIAKSVKSK